MAWKFNNESPIYLQIMDVIRLRVLQGQLKPGDKIASVRELAAEAGVNPNTMQKALSELEREGILSSQRTSGRFVADEAKDMSSMRNEAGLKHLSVFVKGMRDLGYTDDEILKRLDEYLKTTKNSET